MLTQDLMQQADPTQSVLLTHDRPSNSAGVALTDIIAVKAATTARKEKRMFGIRNDTKATLDLFGKILNDFGTVG